MALIERNLISAINVSIEKSKQLFYKSLGDSRQKFPSEKKDKWTSLRRFQVFLLRMTLYMHFVIIGVNK